MNATEKMPQGFSNGSWRDGLPLTRSIFGANNFAAAILFGMG